MNIFLPYENDIQKSVESLDDKRLNKQVLETYQLLRNAIDENMGKQIKGYKNHPIYVHYKNYMPFLAIYGYKCCCEFQYRFNKVHKLTGYFMKKITIFSEKPFDYIPFYMEGSKGQPNYIRTTENVSELYKKKLIKKWVNDYDNGFGRFPTWTKRGIPDFFKGDNFVCSITLT